MSGDVRLTYASGWREAFAHYSLGGPWTQAPGVPMRVLFAGKLHTIIIPCSGRAWLEVCFNDGGQQWDSAGGKNYKLEVSPGARFVIQNGHVRAIPDSQQPFLTVSDLDGTMVGNDAGDNALRNFSNHFVEHLAPAGCVLAYSTGRSPSSFKELLAAKPLLRPQVLVLGVGTQIYESAGTDWKLDYTWEARITTGWNRTVAEDCAKVFPELQLQAASEQSPLKLSFIAPADETPRLKKALEAALGAKGVQACVVVSGSGSHRYLDCIPERAGKFNAMLYVRSEKLGFPAERTLVAGDSGNDIDMFKGDEFGVVVGNGHQELVEFVRGRGRPHRHLIARAHAADGIREAIAHFKL